MESKSETGASGEIVQARELYRLLLSLNFKLYYDTVCNVHSVGWQHLFILLVMITTAYPISHDHSSLYWLECKTVELRVLTWLPLGLAPQVVS